MATSRGAGSEMSLDPYLLRPRLLTCASNSELAYCSILSGMLGLRVDCCSYRLTSLPRRNDTSLCIPR